MKREKAGSRVPHASLRSGGGYVFPWPDALTPPASALRHGFPGFSAAVARLLDLPLDAFAEAGQALEVAVSWYPRPLWFVPTAADAEALMAEGTARPGETWTAAELAQVVGISGITSDRIKAIALAKTEFLGEVVEVRALNGKETV